MRPVIETNRLTLRRLTAKDCGRVVELLSAWDIARMTSSIAHPYTTDDFHAWQAGHDAGWAEKRDFPYAVTTTRDGVIGCIGMAARPDAEAYEIGYWIGMPYWGQGYATEAGAALLAQTRVDLAPSSITSRHFVENTTSGHVLEKLGFIYTGEVKPSPCLARGHNVDSRIMELPEPRQEERS